MPGHPPTPDELPLTRRDLLGRCGMGLGILGLAMVMDEDGTLVHSASAGSTSASTLAEKQPHFAPQAKRVVHLFMNGGPSHVDTFDPKPLLDKYHGQPLPTNHFRTERQTGGAMRSPFKFRRYGESGIEVSELFAQTARHIDDIAVIRSMRAEVPNHEPSLMLMNCGNSTLPRPSVGAWVNYGLGSENQNLPGFIVMCPGGYPIVATRNWQSAFLPGAYQGTHIDTNITDPRKLIANIQSKTLAPTEQRRQLDLVHHLNERHLQQRQRDAQLEARIETFELAYRMQSEATNAFDFTAEPQHVRDMYGSGIHGRQLLITRRLLERGVRYVQVYSGAEQPWDNHANIEAELRNLAAGWDQPIAALLSDLKQRGLLESTLVLWGGEFGRTPVAELPGLNGRDHNHYGFTCWMAGGGVRGGYVHGATDDTGFIAVEDPVHVHDLHATMLHLLGLDHEKLTYRYAGRDFRLTDVHGKVIQQLIA